MAWFRKGKSIDAPRPKVCHRCHRVGSVAINSLSAAAGHDDEWWLCADCARELRGDERRES